jgi:deoxyribonuclease V
MIGQWKAEQAELSRKMVVRPLTEVPRYVAGADVAFAYEMDKVVACALVYDRQEDRLVEVVHAVRPLEVPYVPTFLSFREGPAVMAAIGKLAHPFGVICFDGQGLAHPRRCGLATHVGVSLDLPAIGCAKSRLMGTFEQPAEEAGASSPLMDKGEQIGVVLRTRPKVNPIFVSVGHKVDLPSAIRVLLACRTKYRIPEPTRRADIEVAKIKQKVLAGES